MYWYCSRNIIVVEASNLKSGKANVAAPAMICSTAGELVQQKQLYHRTLKEDLRDRLKCRSTCYRRVAAATGGPKFQPCTCPSLVHRYQSVRVSQTRQICELPVTQNANSWE